jgi:type IV pilus assembly protein PilY1
MKAVLRIAALTVLVGVFPWQAGVAAPEFTISNTPLLVAPLVKPNLMIVLDNSQSMDATMAGRIISGDNPATRSNIARDVLKSVLVANIDSFNWGLSTFATTNRKLYNLQPYYLGGATTMQFTNDCNAVGDTEGKTSTGQRCIKNPQTGNGFSHITFAVSGDDPIINDVFYTDSTDAQQYGRGLSGTEYRLCSSRNVWTDNNFNTGCYPILFTPTDAGYLFSASNYPRALFVKRDGWGWGGDFGINDGNNVTGLGTVLEPIKGDFLSGFSASTHKANLENKLAVETNNANSGEIKNSALFTPLAGSLKTVRDYFVGQSSTVKSPISHACQKSFVVLATDGNPTANESGIRYTGADLTPDANGWNNAQKKVFERITDLRATQLSSNGNNRLANTDGLVGKNFDIMTYIVGMGETVANEASVKALNEMAKRGGAYPTAFLGTDPESLKKAFNDIANNITETTSSASSAALNSGSWNTGSRVYQANFSVKGSDWSGDVSAFTITATGVIGTTPVWRAGPQIDAQNWDNGRRIITYKPSAKKGIAFRWPANASDPGANELDPAQVQALRKDGTTGESDLNGALRLAYLRGDDTRELRRCANPPCAAPQFRNRASGPLGDIVNSAPFYVGAPPFGYRDNFEATAYSSFALANKGRAPVLYVGANDGMLHAISAADGKELFAYIPSQVYGDLTRLTSPAYTHRYYVDGSPTAGDVYYDGAWRTVLVSGMRAGAKGLFALDVTDPGRFSSESNAPSVALWEFTDPDMGFVYGQPLIVKTNNGKWSVIVGGGYNSGNSSGNAVLFVIDVKTGEARKIDTGAGTPDSPNGLSEPAAIDTNSDGIVDVVYAGDLNGNLWKFNLSSFNPNSWSVGNQGEPLFSAGTSKPITGALDVAPHPRGGYLIGFGTGRYLAASDHSTSTSGQSVYAIRDSLSDSGTTLTLAQLQQQSILPASATRLGATFRLSTHAVGAPGDAFISDDKDNVISRQAFLTNKRGWYLNLPTAGERVVTNARFLNGRLILTSMIPNTVDPCKPDGSGWLLAFDALTGNRLGSPTFDTDRSLAFDTGDFLIFSDVSSTKKFNASGTAIDGVPATSAVIRGSELDILVTSDSTGGPPQTDPTLGGQWRNSRAMWREVR